MAGCGDVLSLEDLQTAKKHQIFEAEVITGKAGGVAGGATIGTATNPVTGQTQQTLPSILADLGFDVQSWTSSTGGVLASANQVFLNDTSGSLGLGDYYAWGGTFPKTVPAGTDPALVSSGYIMRSSRFAGTQAREALRRICAEAGDNLVDGSLEAGGTLVNPNDVLLQERTGKVFSGPAGAVAAGTNPAIGGFTDVSHRDLRSLVTNKSRVYLSSFFNKGYNQISYSDDATQALRRAIRFLKPDYVYTPGHTPDQAARSYYDDGGGGVVVIDCPCRITDTVIVPAFVQLAQVGSVTGGFGKRYDIQNLFTKPDNLFPIYVDISDQSKIGIDVAAIHYQTGLPKVSSELYESIDIDSKTYLQAYGSGIKDLYIFTDKPCGMAARIAGAQASHFSGVIRGTFDIGLSVQSSWGCYYPQGLLVGQKTCLHYYNINSVEFGSFYHTPGSTNWSLTDPLWPLMSNIGVPAVTYSLAGRACLSVSFSSLTMEGGQYGYYIRDSHMTFQSLYCEVIADTITYTRNSSVSIDSWRVGCPGAKVVSASRRTFMDIRNFYTVSPSAQDYLRFINVINVEDGYTPLIKLRGTVRFPSVSDVFSPHLDWDNEKQYREIWIDPVAGLDVNTGFSPDNPIKTLSSLGSRLSKTKPNWVYLGGDVRGDGTIADATVIFKVWAGKVAEATIKTSSNSPIICNGMTDITIDEGVTVFNGSRGVFAADGTMLKIYVMGSINIAAGGCVFSRNASVVDPSDNTLLFKTGAQLVAGGAIFIYDSGRTSFALHKDMHASTSPLTGGTITLGGLAGSTIIKVGSKLVP